MRNVLSVNAGVKKPGTPAMPLGTGGTADAVSSLMGANGPRVQTDDTPQGAVHSSSSQLQKQSGEATASAPSTAGSPAEAGKFTTEKLDAAQSALRQKKSQQTHQGQKTRSFWGYVTDYIIGADKLIQ